MDLTNFSNVLDTLNILVMLGASIEQDFQKNGNIGASIAISVFLDKVWSAYGAIVEVAREIDTLLPVLKSVRN